MRIRRVKTPPKYIIEELKEGPISDVDAYNESRENKLIKRYKSILGLGEDFEITEDNLDEWALRHASNLEGLNYDRSREALLGRKFEGYNG